MTSFLLTFAKITNLASERYARKPILDANQVRVKLTNILKKKETRLDFFLMNDNAINQLHLRIFFGGNPSGLQSISFPKIIKYCPTSCDLTGHCSIVFSMALSVYELTGQVARSSLLVVIFFIFCMLCCDYLI